MADFTFSDIHDPGSKNPEVLRFDLLVHRPSTPVFVSREALEDLATLRGVDIGSLAGGLVEFAQSVLPELASTASRKMAMQEAVTILAGDQVR